MTLRNTSGKFSLGGFGRKASDAAPHSPSRTNGNYSDDPSSPNTGNLNSSGSGGGGFDLGKKLGKSIAHQSLLPGLGNKEIRGLQDVINAEKGVLVMAEKLGLETQKAAAALPPYGAAEGPDLQDVLTHSSTLLSQLGSALSVFVDHSANLRQCYKRVREREEALDELRRRRRATGAKAETAEKKLAKMGPENKSLPSQTELLERLRGEMRQMDTDIINEESKLGDYKRQQIKEALSYKFGGLEELGEKMCIIGELGKLLLEEVPLEETPPGYGRAPYVGYERTENAVNEATKCLATVKFSAGSASPKAPGLPPHQPAGGLGTPTLPNISHVAAAEEFAHYPGGHDMASPQQTKGKGREYSMDESDPYGGLSNPYDRQPNGEGQRNIYDEYGGTRKENGRHVVWQGPTDDALQGASGHQREEGVRDYEYEQQKQLDAEERAWQESQSHPPHAGQAGFPEDAPPSQDTPTGDGGLHVPWQPLNVRRDHSATPDPITLRDGAPTLETPDLGEHIAASQNYASPTDAHDLAPPPPIGQIYAPPSPTPGERDGYFTPPQGPTPEPTHTPTLPNPPLPPPPPPAPIPLPSPALPASGNYSAALGGKISAAAFRRNKPRGSTDYDDPSQSQQNSPESSRAPGRRLPQPPVQVGIPNSNSGNVRGPETPLEANFELPASPTEEQQAQLGHGHDHAQQQVPNSPPPGYHSESLR